MAIALGLEIFATSFSINDFTERPLSLMRSLYGIDLKLLETQRSFVSRTTLTQDQSWLKESAQRNKWRFCLLAARMAADQERNDDETIAADPHAGLQGEGSAGS